MRKGTRWTGWAAGGALAAWICWHGVGYTADPKPASPSHPLATDAAASQPRTAREFLVTGRSYYQQGRYADAVDALEAALSAPGQLQDSDHRLLSDLLIKARSKRNELAAATTITARGQSADTGSSGRSANRGDWRTEAPGNDRQAALKLMAEAKVAADQGDIDTAAKLALQAKSLPVRWNPAEESPTRFLQSLASLQNKKSNAGRVEVATNSSAPAVEANSRPEQRRVIAQQWLGEGRKAMKEGRYEDAEQLAQKASGLQVQYRLLEDSPEKLLEDLREARRVSVAKNTRGPQPKAGTVAAANRGNAAVGSDALRDRADGLMRQARQAQQSGNPAEAMRLAMGAAEMERSGLVAYQPGEARPSDFINQLKSAAGTVSGSKLASNVSPRISSADDSAGEEPLATPEALEQRLAASQATATEKLASDPKALSAELLKQARADLKSGRADEARRKAIEAGQLDVAYTLFDERPEHVLADIDRVTGQTSTIARKSSPARPQAELIDRNRTASTPKSASPDKQKALQLLARARSDMQEGRVDEARAKLEAARDLKVVYDLFDDRPELALADLERLSKTKNIAKAPTDDAVPAVTKVAARRIPDTVSEESPITTASGASASRGGATESARAKQLVKEARASLSAGRTEEARAKALAAKGLNATYGLLDDQPDSITSDIDALARTVAGSKKIPSAAGNPSAPDGVEVATSEPKQLGSAAEAELLLKSARAAIAAGNLDEAKRKVESARKLDVAYGLFDDHPDAVAGEIQKRELFAAKAKSSGQPAAAASAKPRQSPEQAKAKQFLSEARQALKDGDLEAAHAKVEAAQQLDVPFGLFDDRPDLVLADIEKLARTANIASNTPRTTDDAMPSDAADENLASDAAAPISDGDVVPAAGRTADVAVIHPESESAADLFNLGLKSLRAGQRDKAYEYFLRAHQSGQQLDRFRSQQLQDFLVTLSPRGSKIKQAAGQVPSLELPGSEPRPIDIVADQQAAKLDKYRTEVLNATFKAEKLSATNPDAAYKLLDEALASIENSDLSQEVATPLVRSLQRTREEIAAQAKLSAPKRELAARNAEVKDRIKLEEQTKLRIGQELADKVEQFNELMDQQRFAEAEVLAKQAKELDPENPAVIVMVEKAKLARRIASNEDVRNRAADGRWKAWDDVEQSNVIPLNIDSGIVYDAKKWDELTKKRSKYGRDNRVRTEEEQRIEKSLNREVSLHFENAPLRDVVKHLVTIAGVNVVLDDLGLDEAGVTTETPVTINVDGIRMKSALNLLLDPLRLGYTIKDEVLKITSHTRRRGDMILTTYSVADLVVPLSNTPQPMGSLANPLPNQMPNPRSGVTVGYGGQMNVGPLGGLQRPANQAFAQVDDRSASLANGSRGSFGVLPGNQQNGLAGGGVQADFQPLIDLLTATVAPDTWDTVGGEGTVSQFDQTLSLVIRQTAAVHDEIADLLNQLRRLQDLQVTIEVRFITVDDNFFERIGVDFDFNVQDTIGGPDPATFGQFLPPNGGGTVFGQQQQQQQQQGQQQQQQQQQGAAGAFQPSPPRDLVNRDSYRNVVAGLEPVSGNPVFTNTLDVPFRQGSFSLGIPTFGGARNAPDAGLTVGMAILNDIETFLLIEAAQGDTRTNVMQAPKVTLFNGQSATLISGQAQNFVTSVTPTVGLGSVGLQPQIQTLLDGIVMSVTAVISADRRYVRLGVSPQFTTISGVDTFTFQGGAGGQQGQQGQGGLVGGQQGGGGGQIGGQGGGLLGLGGIGGQQGQQGQNNIFAPSISVQLPRQDIVTVLTTVSVPDGGTVLLGGVKRLAEGRNMFGVPILNKIPYISRLFKNTGVGRETRSVMLMVTPRIIIQEEEEQLLGIPL